MNALLTAGHVGGTFELTPCNKRLRARLKRETGEGSVLFQSDFDLPGLARSLGWSGKIGRERCRHNSTAGTGDCAECGRRALQFISAASDWLYSNDGRVFRTGGDYFGQEGGAQ